MVDFWDLDTPCVLVDVDSVRRNIAKMQSLAHSHGKKLRPHVKTHKIPLFAEWQIEAGASGICVQKTAEAEVMAKHGIKDILISNEVIGRQKTDRVAALAELCTVSVAADSELGVAQMSASAYERGVEVGVYVDVDVGMGRCGVRGEAAAKLAGLVARSRGLYFKGVMGYDGHTSRIVDPAERRRAVEVSRRILGEAVSAIKTQGISVEELSVGGTPSSAVWAEFEEVSELQPGTYVFYDAHQVELGAARKEECALTLLATVTSRPTQDRAVIDAGSKSFGFDQGRFPIPLDVENVAFAGFSEEHGVLRPLSGEIGLELGQKLRFIPHHVCVTVDLWDHVYLVKGEKSVAKISVEARGKRE